ncbi:hypothetical protein, partial [Microbispora hainanensis]|uniref:hypothetical protein n=1 Tax=Microbispora hainanensis TaxID=568844 RepID=UPI00340BF31B
MRSARGSGIVSRTGIASRTGICLGPGLGSGELLRGVEVVGVSGRRVARVVPAFLEVLGIPRVFGVVGGVVGLARLVSGPGGVGGVVAGGAVAEVCEVVADLVVGGRVSGVFGGRVGLFGGRVGGVWVVVGGVGGFGVGGEGFGADHDEELGGDLLLQQGDQGVRLAHRQRAVIPLCPQLGVRLQ